MLVRRLAKAASCPCLNGILKLATQRMQLSNCFFNLMDWHGSTVLQKSLYQNFSRENLKDTSDYMFYFFEESCLSSINYQPSWFMAFLFGFENEENVSSVYGDESIAKALHILFKSQIGAIAVIDRQTWRFMGSVRSSDVYLLMENDNLLHNRK
ncbi:hypothetical protein CRYUN_Cryun04dG0043500 [Craigia yunnanensis]